MLHSFQWSILTAGNIGSLPFQVAVIERIARPVLWGRRRVLARWMPDRPLLERETVRPCKICREATVRIVDRMSSEEFYIGRNVPLNPIVGFWRHENERQRRILFDRGLEVRPTQPATRKDDIQLPPAVSNGWWGVHLVSKCRVPYGLDLVDELRPQAGLFPAMQYRIAGPLFIILVECHGSRRRCSAAQGAPRSLAAGGCASRRLPR